MIGFKTQLSTQDVMLQLHAEVIDPPNKTGTKAIFALDLEKAFDNVSHEAILQTLANINAGNKTFNYIPSFLSGRTAGRAKYRRTCIGQNSNRRQRNPARISPLSLLVQPSNDRSASQT